MLPDFLMNYFEVASTTSTEKILHLYFEETTKPPQEFNASELVSKDFLDNITIQDFPLRSKLMYLHIKSRRYTYKTNREIIKRYWTLANKGTCMTQEFATFKKKINS